MTAKLAGYKDIFIFNHFCRVGHVYIHIKRDCSRCFLESTSSCKHCICADFYTLIPKLRTIRLKANLVANKTVQFDFLQHMVPLLSSEEKKNLAALKNFFTKHFSTLFPPPIKNRTKIKCSTHKSVKKIAKFFLSCNKIVLGFSSLNQIIQCPSFWVHHLLYVPLSLNCREMY